VRFQLSLTNSSLGELLLLLSLLRYYHCNEMHAFFVSMDISAVYNDVMIMAGQ